MGKRLTSPAFGSLLLAVAILTMGGFLGGKSLFEGASAEKTLAASPTAVYQAEATPYHDTVVDLAAQLPLELVPSTPAIVSDQAAADPIVFDGPLGETPVLAPTALPPIATVEASDRPATTTPTSRGASATSLTPDPTPTPKAKQQIGLQAGHWKAAEQSDEFASLRKSTGAEGAGWAEWQVNLDVANRAASLLRSAGYIVDVLPSSLPEQYKADVFLSLHGDANSNTKLRGFKVARAVRSAIPRIDDALVAAVYRKYAEITGMPREDRTITNNMLYYYAFAGGKARHTVAPTTPAAILEMGFLTTPSDRQLMTHQPDLIAKAVAASLIEFLDQGGAQR